MSFFNKKEEVIDFELTQHGKRLLSIGKLNPVFYSFYDDDIIYDVTHVSTGSHPTPPRNKYLENQKDINNRVFDSIRTKVQYNFAGVETNHNVNPFPMLDPYSNQATLGNIMLYDMSDPAVSSPQPFMVHQDKFERNYALGMPIGNSSPAHKFAPSWDIQIINGQMIDSSRTLNEYMHAETGKDIGNKFRIPQLNITMSFDLTIHNMSVDDPMILEDLAEEKGNLVQTSHVFDDGSFLKVEGPPLMLKVEEHNVSLMEEQFDIEIFEIIEGQLPESDNIVPVDLIPLLARTSRVDPASNTVSHYFEVLADDQLDVDSLPIFSQTHLSSAQLRSAFESRVNPYTQIQSTGNIRENSSLEDIYRNPSEEVEDCD